MKDNEKATTAKEERPSLTSLGKTQTKKSKNLRRVIDKNTVPVAIFQSAV